MTERVGKNIGRKEINRNILTRGIDRSRLGKKKLKTNTKKEGTKKDYMEIWREGRIYRSREGREETGNVLRRQNE